MHSPATMRPPLRWRRFDSVNRAKVYDLAGSEAVAGSVQNPGATNLMAPDPQRSADRGAPRQRLHQRLQRILCILLLLFFRLRGFRLRGFRLRDFFRIFVVELTDCGSVPCYEARRSRADAFADRFLNNVKGLFE